MNKYDSTKAPPYSSRNSTSLRGQTITIQTFSLVQRIENHQEKEDPDGQSHQQKDECL